MKRMLIATVMAATLITTIQPAAAFATAQADEMPLVEVTVGESAEADQITRLYLTTLGRMPDAEGHAYWTALREKGMSLADIAEFMIELPEPQATTSGDWIVDAYRNGLDRAPDGEGYEFWSQYRSGDAIAAIADSVELQTKTGTLPPPPPSPEVEEAAVEEATIAERHPDVPAGWVDAGHGVYVPPILIAIRFCESTHNYQAANRFSSARGAYQFLTSSWAAYGHDDRYGVSQAHLATNAQQDEAALITWQRDGTRPWNASRHCWG